MNPLQMPALLAGPIIRRVESSKVFIWLATSRKYSIKPTLYDIINDEIEGTYIQRNIKFEQQTVQFGENLFIHLIELKPAQGLFPSNQLFGYNLVFKNDDDHFDLGDLGLLSSRNHWSIVYGDLKFPSFFINQNPAHNHFLYGSCRKLHGDGEDRLAYGNAMLEQRHSKPEQRPSALFLTGDQIYADDIPDPIFRVVSTLAEQLIGGHENLEHLDQRLSCEPFNKSIRQINGRQFIMEKFCEFTSTSAHNHLMTFGEYAVLYLLSWSPTLWEVAQEQGLFESFDDAVNHDHVYFNFPHHDDDARVHQKEKAKLLERYEEQQEAMIHFQTPLYQIRKLLSNIPVYMIFDDHDITDDWNITKDWKKDVRQSPLGKHVIANALTAYWAFQGWGNDPKAFNQEFTLSIQNYFTASLVEEIEASSYEHWVDVLWHYDRWHFVAPTSPKAIFLDTRTQRKYDIKPRPIKIGSIIEAIPQTAQLINEKGWKTINQLLSLSGWKRGDPLIIVSATPVYGVGLIESFLHRYVYPLRVLGINVHTLFDFEAWKYNVKGFSEFLLQVAEWRPDPCIILSGDVHYGSAVDADVYYCNGQHIKINQFTVSPLKNMSFGQVWGFLLKVILKINTRRRNKKNIYRYCDTSYQIRYIEEKEFIDCSFIWKDKLRYRPVDQDAIMETDNHIGLLSLKSGIVKSQYFARTEDGKRMVDSAKQGSFK